MESYEERMQKLIEQDIPPFLALCSEKDRKFLLKRDSDRTTEEYVRLLYIGLAFKMRGVFFRILGEAEHRGHADEVISEFPETGKDLAKLDCWIKDFICAIADERLRRLAAEFWQSQRAAPAKRLAAGCSPPDFRKTPAPRAEKRAERGEKETQIGFCGALFLRTQGRSPPLCARAV